MGLKERIQEDMRKAAKERDSLALSALRMAIAAVKNKEIETRGPLADADVFKLLSTMIKQRREAADLYRKGHRPELAEKEAQKRRQLEEEGREKIRLLAEKRKAARRAAQEAGEQLDDDWNEDDYDVDFEYRP